MVMSVVNKYILNFLSIFHCRTFGFLLGLTILLLASCDVKKEEEISNFPSETQMHMALDTLLQACWNNKDISKLEIVMSKNASRRVNNIIVANSREEVAANIAVFISGFPDLNISFSNVLISDNYASFNWTFLGTNTGIFGEFPATGKKVKVNGISKVLFNKEGKIIEEDVTYNELDLLQQLGYSLEPPTIE